MPQKQQGTKGVYVELPDGLAEEMKQLAERNGRSFRDEMTSAVRRHLATPPVIVEGPPVASEEVAAGGEPRKGRPRKKRESEGEPGSN